MKKFLIVTIILCLLTSVFVPFGGAVLAANENEGVKSYYLIDYDTGTVLSKFNEDEKRPIASMVKIMTLCLTFKAIEEGRLDINQKLVISETASGMGGSQMFLDAHKEYAVKDLIKGVVVCSANDAAVALGEAISGSVESFVADMNAYAKELGMNNTLFCNTTGLPGEGQYSTARDVSIMTKKLLGYKDYYQFSGIWIEEYVHPDGRKTEMVNTNKLIRFYQGCDAGKTGFTNEAMFCLSASAARKDMRVIATVLGGSDSKTRFKKVSELFNYAFANYEQKMVFKAGESIINNLKISKSKEQNIDVYSKEDLKIFCQKGAKVSPNVKIVINENLKAPLSADTVIGKAEVYDAEGNLRSTTELCLRYDVKKQNIFDAIKYVLKNWRLKK